MPSGNFAIYYNGDCLINYELAKNYYNLTDQQVASSGISGRLKAKILLDRAFFVVERKEFKKIVEVFDGTVQNLDEADSRLIKYDGHSSVKETVYVPESTELCVFNGVKYVEFKNLKLNQKYNKKDHIPHIKVCGSLFAAIDCVFNDTSSYLIKIKKGV